MIFTPSSESVMKTKASTSYEVGTKTPSSAVLQMVTSVMRPSLFSATELMVSKIDLAHVFHVKITLCEYRSVTATSVEICNDIVVEHLQRLHQGTKQFGWRQRQKWSHN